MSENGQEKATQSFSRMALRDAVMIIRLSPNA